MQSKSSVRIFVQHFNILIKHSNNNILPKTMTGFCHYCYFAGVVAQ